MKFRMLLAASLAGGLAAAGCNGGGGKHDERGGEAAVADRSAVADAIRAQEAQWVRRLAARDADAVAAIFTADGTLAYPGSAVTGTQQIRADHVRIFEDAAFQVQFASDRVEVAGSGEIAYARGRYTAVNTDDETRRPVTESGIYLSVWRRQDDGSWKAAEAFYVPGPTAAAPDAGGNQAAPAEANQSAPAG